MEVPSSEELLQFLSSCLSQIKWRLKSNSKRRLEIDVLALCTGMRPVVMIDYGGKMPELQNRLLSLLELIREGLPVFKDLKVMVIEDMIYLINVRSLPKFVSSSLDSEPELFFIDLEQDPPKMVTQSKESNLGMQLRSIQKLFSSTFPLDDSNTDTTTMAAGLSSCVSIWHRSHRRSNLQPIHQIPPPIQSSSMQEWYHREGLSFRRANKFFSAI
ncbi:hypothetical protein AT3G59490 [Arabidopsis thaliana]|uniref:Uncharacterized protein n=1 Tax=Arabidopsis thaliana TaxID=3702 RepID=A0A1I9LP78_ARATH|nr:uncharacterized protein AT3G59490 [Arabidopsis thaliana]ANM64386.1 hypothetical protein AT3G59490 [Arabidopsis thaliana]|eukprot:NP_001326417.1 hypothetical protein AT3G59490 [Arabidopsis thaliana]